MPSYLRQQNNRPATISRRRVHALLFGTLAISALIGAQLVHIQIGEHDALAAQARNEFAGTRVLLPKRGTITDRAGNVLAFDVEKQSLFAVPKLLTKTPDKTARLALVLAGLLGMPAADVEKQLTYPKTSEWSPIKRWLDPEVAAKIADLNEDGLRLVYEPRRVYPQGNYAAQIIGAANLEGTGISGVEAFYDKQLKGITGTLTAEWDSLGNPIWLKPPQTNPADDGAQLELTLDPMVQHVVEDELQRAVAKWKPKSATIIVLDPQTGAVRGMTSYPSFDPNRYFDYDPQLYNVNPAIAQIYEPGSTFKMATIAIGLEAKAFSPNTTVYDGGVIDREGYSLSNWNGGGNGDITPAKVLYFSSNVGALQFNEMTGPAKFYKAVKQLGYGEPTGIDVAGEGGGIVKSPDMPSWGPIDLYTNAYGQGIAVTPLQQVRMAATIANGGKVLRPYVVQKICHNGTCTETKPEVVSRPFSAETTAEVRAMLVDSANHYGGVVWGEITGDLSDQWLVPGYKVAAKTGTSDISAGTAGYTGRVVGSVLGFGPVDAARYAVLVKIDEPDGDAYGVMSAIPTYQAVMDELLRFDRVKPDPELVHPGQAIGPARKPDS